MITINATLNPTSILEMTRCKIKLQTLQRKHIQVCSGINRGISWERFLTGCATVIPGKGEKTGEENPDSLAAESSTADSNPDQIFFMNRLLLN